MDYNQYWEEILPAYRSLPTTLSEAERWRQAHHIMQPICEHHTDDPIMTNKSDCAKIYAEAIHYMMLTRGTHLVLPANFSKQWTAEPKWEEPVEIDYGYNLAHTD